MIDQSFIKAIIDTAETKLFETADGKRYSSKPLSNLPLPTEPQFPTINLYNLDSLADYIKEGSDHIELLGCQVVCGENEVKLFGPPRGENRRRDVYVSIASGAVHPRLGCYLSLEDFRIELLTRFEDSPDRTSILQLIAKVSDENIKTSIDDGVSQTVTAKIGLATFAQVQVPSPVQLVAIRTFPEIAQPGSLFIFRMQSGKGLPEAALFEIDTNWKREAARRIAGYLKINDDLKALTILA